MRTTAPLLLCVMLAVPLGLMSAIYLTQYAPARLRSATPATRA